MQLPGLCQKTAFQLTLLKAVEGFEDAPWDPELLQVLHCETALWDQTQNLQVTACPGTVQDTSALGLGERQDTQLCRLCRLCAGSSQDCKQLLNLALG